MIQGDKGAPSENFVKHLDSIEVSINRLNSVEGRRKMGKICSLFS